MGKTAQEKMIESEVFRALFTQASEGIIIVHKGVINKVNFSAYKLFGYDPGELIGQSIDVLVPDKYRDGHENHRTKYESQPKARPMGKGLELYGQKKDGSVFPLEISLSPFEQGGERYILAFIVDNTDRKKAEEKLKNYSAVLEREVKDRTLVLEEAISQLERTKDELKEALDKEKELNDLKSRFVSMASHEFRTPLATILSSVSLISKYNDAENLEKKNKHISRIKSSVNNLTDILNDFLSLSKLEEGKISFDPIEFNLHELSSTVVQEMQSIAKQDQKIDFSFNANENMYSDKKIIRNILINLISNAIKFSNEDGTIKVNISYTKKHFILEVADTGIGISNEDKKHLFERFFRGKNATNIGGTGLGLNIVSKYVELLKGKIELQSELGKGTTFIITIPDKQKPSES